MRRMTGSGRTTQAVSYDAGVASRTGAIPGQRRTGIPRGGVSLAPRRANALAGRLGYWSSVLMRQSACTAILPGYAPEWCMEIIMAVKLIIGASAIDKAILSIKNRGARLDHDIQLAGLSVLAHIEAHGDTTLADRLFNAMPKGARRLALAEWMLAFGKVEALQANNPEHKERVAAGHVFGFAKTKNTDMEGAEGTPWHEFKKEKSVAEAFDVQAALASLLKRVQGMQAKGVRIEHADKIEALAKLVA